MPLEYKRQPIQALDSGWGGKGNCPLMLSWLLWPLNLLFAIAAVVFGKYLSNSLASLDHRARESIYML